MKYTTGPWIVEAFDPHIKKNRPICIFSASLEVGRCFQPHFKGRGYAYTQPIALANARLMAAAPDLLDDLKQAVEMLSAFHQERPEGPGLATRVMQRFRTTIARAEGSES